MSGADELYSVESAAKWLGGVSVWTVRAWLSQGRLQRTKVGGRTMIRHSELQRFVEASNRENQAEKVPLAEEHRGR